MSARKTVPTHTEVKDGVPARIGALLVLYKRTGLSRSGGYYWISDSRRDDGACVEVSGQEYWTDYREAIRAAKRRVRAEEDV